MSELKFNPKGHRYELDGKPVTGVTSILAVIAKPALIGWAANVTAEWIRENCAELKALPTATRMWIVAEEQLQEAVKAHTKKKEAGGDAGKLLHSEVEAYIKHCIDSLHGGSGQYKQDVSPGLNAFIVWAMQNNIKFLSSETPTYSKDWFVAGTPDFTFEKDGKRFVGDLKTYKKIWDRVPHFQCAAYAKMLTEHGEHFDGTCIVNISKDTLELTDAWTYDLEGDTKAFEACLFLYRQLANF